MTNPIAPSDNKLPHEFVENYIKDGQPKMSRHIPMPWSEMNAHMKDVVNWYVKHHLSYSSQVEVAWHIIATNYIANGDQGITIKEADTILAYWTKEGNTLNPEPIGVQMYHG
jgi:hypothetical protein